MRPVIEEYKPVEKKRGTGPQGRTRPEDESARIAAAKKKNKGGGARRIIIPDEDEDEDGGEFDELI